MEKTYNCWTENEEGDCLDFETIFYMVKNRLLIELDLENGYVIRQRKDIPMTYETYDETFEMDYGKLYLTDGGPNIYKVWNGRGEDGLEEWLEECKNFNP